MARRSGEYLEMAKAETHIHFIDIYNLKYQLFRLCCRPYMPATIKE
jgi:hypothetical protein